MIRRGLVCAKKDLGWDRGMKSKKAVQHVYLVGAKSMGAYGGYETFVYKLTEYRQKMCFEVS